MERVPKLLKSRRSIVFATLLLETCSATPSPEVQALSLPDV